MTMTKEITSEQVSSVVLHSLDLTQDTVVKKDTATLRQIVLEQQKEATIVFAARRPGCVLCREHGKQLSNLQSSPKIAVLGVVKEIGVDDAGLKTFQKEYFNSWPIYLDEDLQLYKIMGNRSIFKVKTMFKLLGNMRKLSRRMSQKRIEGNLVGEGTIQGGILIFDGKGDLVHVQLEDITKELNMSEMAEILETIVGEDGSRGIPAEAAPPRHCFNKGQVCPECT
ncbi:prostamide/prostaglandin F2alpha synthase [Fistulifera solaris]|uniref:Peroxiredoxin-like 2A n=1 Tax=Fistulifera solaris TaxID=1519565 RepID=A0A1Z5KLP9_FISSO|nr:prostamide/prostaglandin F2alpha synthase [Fistulifera solaris]|eukprot:GAX27206.1 prostamide/prostaglandin F2alpha synthase [Fistulifera solaris]